MKPYKDDSLFKKERQLSILLQKIYYLKGDFKRGKLPDARWRGWEVTEYHIEHKDKKEYTSFESIPIDVIEDLSKKVFEKKIKSVWTFTDADEQQKFLDWCEENLLSYDDAKKTVKAEDLIKHLEFNGKFVVGKDGPLHIFK